MQAAFLIDDISCQSHKGTMLRVEKVILSYDAKACFHRRVPQGYTAMLPANVMFLQPVLKSHMIICICITFFRRKEKSFCIPSAQFGRITILSMFGGQENDGFGPRIAFFDGYIIGGNPLVKADA